MPTAAIIENIVCYVTATAVFLFAPGGWKLLGLALLCFAKYLPKKTTAK